MSLLKLAPESDRLRRLTKAHAAGELAKSEYRRLRAEVIAGFGSEPEDDASDVTERRALESDPAPRTPSAPRATPPTDARPRAPRLWGWLFGVVVVSIAMFALAQAADADGGSIQRFCRGADETVFSSDGPEALRCPGREHPLTYTDERR